MFFSEILRNELEFQGLSLNHLAMVTGISRRTIEHYVSVKNPMTPNVKNALLIAKALNVSVEYLCSCSEPNQLKTVDSATIDDAVYKIKSLQKEERELLMKIIDGFYETYKIKNSH